MRNALWSVAASLAIFLCLLPTSLVAQVGRSGITGNVTDSTGAVVPNAQVTIRNDATNVVWPATSNSDGLYTVRDLPPGSYTVTVEASGFDKVITKHVQTEVDRLSSVNMILPVGSVRQTVEVSAPTTLVDTTSGTIGNLVSQKDLESLPLNGRSWINLNYLTPGVTTFIGFSMNFSNITESVAPGNVVANGMRGDMNIYYIDGVSTVDVEDFIISVYPPLDAIAEFRTQSGNPSAEYFGGGGAMISAATKSGTNSFHGSGWEYIRNNVFDSRDYFTKSVPPLKRNQFGFTFGGPIRKDKTFFFGSYEGFRQRQGVPFVGDYPTGAMRGGDLSSISTQLKDPYTGQPIPNNNVAGLINPLSTKWLTDWIPLPNTNVPVGSGNYRVTLVQPIDYNTYLARVDHRFNDRNSIFARYLGSTASSDQPVILSGLTRHQVRYGDNVAAGYTRTLSPNAVVSASFGYHRYDDHEPISTYNNANMQNELGVKGAIGFTTVAASQLAPPEITVSGLAQFGHSYIGLPRRILNDSFYWNGSLDLTIGRHAMSMGPSVSYTRDFFFEDSLPNGVWTYNGTFTGNGFADFLLGLPRTIKAVPNEFNPNARRWTEGLWFQDDWKVNSRLTLNLGLRWDRDGGYVSASNSVANYDLSTPPVAVNFTGSNRPPGTPQALFDAPWSKLFAPRVGFAYKVTDNTVVRGGYGIYWEPMTADPIVNDSATSPFIGSYNLTLASQSVPTFDRANPFASGISFGFGATAIQRNFVPAYISQWNLTVERNIGSNLFLSAAYVGNNGIHLVTYNTNFNNAPPGPGAINPRRPFQELLILPNAGGIAPPGLLPAAGIEVQTSNTSSIYHALDLQAKRRFAHGLSFTASYSFSKAIDDTSEGYIEGRNLAQQQPNNPRAERAVSDFSIKHALTIGYVYELPFGPGKYLGSAVGGLGRMLISGWQLQGLTRLLSGLPAGPTLNGFDNLNNGGSGYPNLVCNPNISGGRSSAAKVAMFFNTSCFTTPPLYSYGDAARDKVIAPGTQLWDISLQKNTSITDRLKTEFRVEFFNAFNHPNFNIPNLTYGTPQFGTITSSAQAPRQIQFGLRLMF